MALPSSALWEENRLYVSYAPSLMGRISTITA
jgi:hypothetical protein